ncbi:hypothetical protein ABZ070_37440 [Streptomyces sp. NPDC006283]|uniref:hypothetical protein n=1 Tax=Streptomyces sp. NPDC006283 TaxID=3156741 RepID=UPI0033A7ED05
MELTLLWSEVNAEAGNAPSAAIVTAGASNGPEDLIQLSDALGFTRDDWEAALRRIRRKGEEQG